LLNNNIIAWGVTHLWYLDKYARNPISLG